MRPANGAPTPRRASSGKSPPPRTSNGIEPLVEELSRTAALWGQIGGEPQEAERELRRAARAEISGHPDEALRLVQSANSRATEGIRVVFDRRLRDLDARQASLTKAGIGNLVEPRLPRLQAALRDRRFHEAAEILDETEQQVARVAEEVESVRQPLTEIDELLGVLAAAGLEPPSSAAEVGELKRALTQGRGSPEDLRRIAQRATELRDALRDHVPTSIRQELEQHEGTLRQYPEDHSEATAARATHGLALGHLEGGRLTDAAAALRELRSAIEGLGPVPLPRVERSAPATPRPAEPVPVSKLIETARILAARVRALDPASELAYESAARIRQATDLLRARRLDEAGETLDQLMLMLDRAEAPEERSASP